MQQGIPIEKARDIVKDQGFEEKGAGFHSGRCGTSQRKRPRLAAGSDRLLRGSDFGIDMQFTNYS